MKNFNKNIKGVTLVSLITTIIVLIILASIGTYSGVEVIKSSKFTKFTTEMKIMQTQVNKLYEQYTNGDDEVLNLGKEININQTVKDQADTVFTSDFSGITDQAGYRYFDQETINSLNIEGIEEEFFINIEKRSVVSYKGIKYEGVTYYTLEQIPNGLYNVEYENKNTGKPTFNVRAKEIGENKWKINISDIEYSGYIEKWKVNYKLEGQDYWNTSKDYSFIVKDSGEYIIQLVNGTITSEERLKVGENTNISSILPSEYQQVEYIESTGTQYIDTGFVANSNTAIEMKASNKSTTNACLYCGRTGITVKTFSAFLINGNALRVDYSNGQYPNLMTATSDTVYTYKQDKNLVYVNDKIVKTLTESEFNTGYNMYLLASHAAGTTLSNIGNVKLYSCKIWDNDVLVRDFIPCYKKDTEEEIGLYDTVSGEFYTNQGTGTFLKGDNVNVSTSEFSEEFKQIEYIKLDSTDPQSTYIVTDIPVSQISTVICKYGYENFLSTWSPMMLSTLNSNNETSAPYVCTNGTKNDVGSINPTIVKSLNLDPTEFTVTYNSSSENVLKIGGWSDNEWTPVGSYYYVKIFDKNNNLIFDGIPCYKKLDNEIGMYDKVNDKFYTNQGTGTFEKGAEVN